MDAKEYNKIMERLDFIEFRQQLLFDNDDVSRSIFEYGLTREQYKRIKNKYLTSNDYNHSSFICYIEAVNNVYNSRKHWD